MKIVVLLLLAVSWTNGSARSSDAGPANPLDPLAALVGPVWVAEFPDGSLTDTQEFEWMFGGKFLRNVHRVANPQGEVVYRGETIYAWDAKSRSILWWYFNSTGGYVTGDATIDGKVVTVSGVNHGGGDQTTQVRGTFELGDGTWSSTSFFWTDGRWKERFTMHFVPVAGPPDP